ncbi:MAG TPA: M20/M25/M40 family metallo-hydrolase [Burkholderiales bacterium]|nr:M20/M25/M40 family metallo-hydrolase [Burkholderiales bacterium]
MFAGYGITAPELSWDDYAGLDVKGKIVIVLRHEPGEKDPHSPFNRTELTRYSELRVKAINARVHGAVGMILVNDVLAHPDAADELIKLGREASPAFAGVVAVHALRRTVEAALGGITIAALEKQIMDAGRPVSRLFAPARARLVVDLKETKTEAKNVIGVLRGGTMAFSDEAIVIGAHYDHLGFGGRDSLDPNNVGKPHNGADDNASGTAALLSIAGSFDPIGTRPKRTLVFIAFTAEESGLGGSSWYVNHPIWRLEKTVAMLNMDMIGRLRDRMVIAFGADTGKEFAAILEQVNEERLAVTTRGDGYGPSDQTAFYAKSIPVLHFFTGAHADYHRTTDDAEKINFEGLAQVARLVRRTAVAIAHRDERVAFVPSSQIASAQGQAGGSGGYGAYFGSIPDFTESDDPGVRITGTRAGSPAEKTGLAAGDRIIKFGEVDIKNLYDLTFALRKYKPGDQVRVKFVRGGESKTVTAILGSRE